MSEAQTASTEAPATPTFRHELTEAEVNVTPAAAEQLKALVDSEEDVEAVRIYVAGGGCGGMTYSMTFATEKQDYDAVLETANGLKIYVDPVALAFLKGVEIDFSEGINGASFVFRNVFQSIGGAGVCSACGAAGGAC
jgi:iron-sulfur cluster insertion protein